VAETTAAIGKVALVTGAASGIGRASALSVSHSGRGATPSEIRGRLRRRRGMIDAWKRR
jgi:NAD(P)-dependent dehydrogenase (short-subunit alcohol dehydrogenase family)